MHEIKSSEVNETKAPEVENYRNIQPENGMTVSEAKEYWDKKLSNPDAESQEQREYRDDNGNLFRVGDELVPNNEYTINGYKYETDSNGRIISAEGKLQVKDHEGRREMDPRHTVDKGNYKETDDRGHLIADMFNGSGGLENVVPMDANLNRGDYVKLEKSLAEAVKDGADVRLKVEPKYEGDSARPSEFKVSYTIDGDKEVVVFRNESEAMS